MTNAIYFLAKLTTVVSVLFIFLMMAGYIGLDLAAQYVDANYIVIPKY